MKLNVRTPLSVVFLLIYGFWTFGPSQFSLKSIFTIDSMNFLAFNIVLAICGFMLLKFEMGQRSGPKISKEYAFKVGHLYPLFSSFILIAYLKRDILQSEITGDELAYAGSASLHARTIGTRVIEAVHLNPGGQHVKNIISFGTFLLIVSIFLFLLLYLKIIQSKFFKFALPLFFIYKFINTYFFHFGSIYLSGFLFPLTITSIFPISDFSIRLVQGFTFTLLIYLVLLSQERFRDLSHFKKFLILLIVSVIPTFANNIFIVEPTTYFVIFASYILIEMTNNATPNFERLLFVSVLCLLFRPTGIVLVIMVLTLWFLHSRKKYFLRNWKIIYLVLPFVLELGLQSVYGSFKGTRFSNPSELASSKNLYIAFFQSAATALDFIGLLILGFSFLVLGMKRKNIRTITSYVLIIFAFYIPLIPKGASGSNKYFIEVVTPIMIAAFYNVSSSAILVMNLRHRFLILVPTMLLVISLVSPPYVRVDSQTSKTGQIKTLVGFPVNSGKMRALILKGLSKQYCLNPSVTYGNFSYVLQGATGDQVAALDFGYNSTVSKLKVTKKSFEIEPGVDCIILDTSPYRALIRKNLFSRNWDIKFSQLKSSLGSRVEVWTSPNSSFPTILSID